jgi:NAD(P)-dependent dehydrogenase (short-subunit alcohol dehydrogenase family)
MAEAVKTKPDQPVCVVLGVGPGNGAAIARRFATDGYQVALLARSRTFTDALARELANTHAYSCDAADPDSIKKTFAQIRRDLGDIDVLVYNAGSGIWGSVEDVSAADMEAAWRINVLGAFTAVREIIPQMKQRAAGSIVFIGATASRRGAAGTAAFAQAKAAQRTLAESMARHLWPVGIHVALVIIDGIVDIPRTRERLPDKPDSFFVNPDDVAQTVRWLTQQPPSAWSFEVEARPFSEKW